MTPRSRFTIAVAYRSHGLGVAVMRGIRIAEVSRHRFEAGCDIGSSIRRLVKKAAVDYVTIEIIVEENSEVHEALRRLKGLAIIAVSLADAKQALIPGTERPTHVQLFQHLLEHHPKLRRLVTVLRRSGQIAINEARRTVPLIAVALGLAAQRANAPFHKQPQNQYE